MDGYEWLWAEVYVFEQNNLCILEKYLMCYLNEKYYIILILWNRVCMLICKNGTISVDIYLFELLNYSRLLELNFDMRVRL